MENPGYQGYYGCQQRIQERFQKIHKSRILSIRKYTCTVIVQDKVEIVKTGAKGLGNTHC